MFASIIEMPRDVIGCICVVEHDSSSIFDEKSPKINQNPTVGASQSTLVKLMEFRIFRNLANFIFMFSDPEIVF